MSTAEFPGGKKFAFTILDDAEVAPLEDLRPIYHFLEELGIYATKIVWSFADERAGAPGTRCTLDDPQYLDFVLELRDRGIEIGWAGASPSSNARARTIEGLELFREVIGHYPRVLVNSQHNRESIYWGTNRVDQPLLKAVVQRAAPNPPGFYLGHVEGSPFWWGDICLNHVDYVLNLTFDDVNITRINPSLPYSDPSRPYVRSWFSGSDAENCNEFNQLLRPDRQDRLEREQGCCILVTRLARGFVKDRRIDRLARKRLESLATRSGWFAVVSSILDHLRGTTGQPEFQTDEWDRMQWKWARDLVRRRTRQTAHRDQPWLDAAIS
jgi:hypothetical protein